MWQGYPRRATGCRTFRSRPARDPRGQPSAERHAELLARLGFASALDLARRPRRRACAPTAARRGLERAARPRPGGAAELLRATRRGRVSAVGARRRHGAHAAGARAARARRRGSAARCAFAVEFLELGLGDASERRLHAGAENARRLPRRRDPGARAARRPGGRAARAQAAAGSTARLGERRVGSRIAVLCRVRSGGRRELALASVHLESHSDPDERAAQLAARLRRARPNRARRSRAGRRRRQHALAGPGRARGPRRAARRARRATRSRLARPGRARAAVRAGRARAASSGAPRTCRRPDLQARRPRRARSSTGSSRAGSSSASPTVIARATLGPRSRSPSPFASP